LTGQTSRTINDHLDLVINALHLVTDILHFVTYFVYSVTNAINLVVHPLNFTVYDFHFFADNVCDPQDFCMRHPSLLLRQSVESLESVLQISQSGQFPQELLCAPFCEDSYHTQPVRNLLADPRFISFVAIPKILRTSTIICVIISVIAVVGDKVVYVSSREKNVSDAFKELCKNIFTRCNALCGL
jgi:hypothetical protein